MKILKQGMIIVIDNNILSGNDILLLSSEGDVISGYNLKSKEVVILNKIEILSKVTEGLWYWKVPGTL